MMKLYYSPGACSLSPHIVLREGGFEFELDRVDGRAKRCESGADFLQINPKGYVPALGLDNGEILTEGVAIVTYLADLRPEAELAPKPGTLARARLQEQLTFISSEVHKGFSPLFAPQISSDVREAVVSNLKRRLAYIEQTLADGRPYLLGDKFSVADAYLFTVARWAVPTKIGLDATPSLSAFIGRIAARKSAREALQREALT